MSVKSLLNGLMMEGLKQLDEDRMRQEVEKETLRAIEDSARGRGFKLVREALHLTEEEFWALQPTWFNGDEQRWMGVELHAYTSKIFAELNRFEYLGEDHGDANVVVNLLSDYVRVPACRSQLTTWIAKAHEVMLRNEDIRTIQERAFQHFVWYRVWYGTNWDYDYYDLRSNPRWDIGQSGVTVDVPLRLVWVPNPVRIEMMEVNCVDDLPDWCPHKAVTVRGETVLIRVPPEWAYVPESDGSLTPA